MDPNVHPEFSAQENLIYLNHAAVAPWPKRTSDAVKAFAEENLRHGTFYYSNWLKKESFLRDQLSELLNAGSSDNIALVKNTSEALSFVAYGIEWKNGDNIVSSDQEFPSNRIPWQSLEHRGVEFREAVLDDSNNPETALFDLVDRNTRLLTISSVQFATGIRVDLERIGEFCKKRDILFCIDAIQSLGAFKMDVEACQADFVMADGHKWMLGPEGLGVFYSTPKARDQLSLTQYGWHMIENMNNYENRPWKIASTARRFECGSINLMGVHALSASLSLLLEIGMETIENAVLDRSAYLCELIQAQEKLELLAPKHLEKRSGIVLFWRRSIDQETLFERLRNNRVVCAKRGPGIRFSPHFYNSMNQLQLAIGRCVE